LKDSERDRVENERERERERVNKGSLSQWVLFFLILKIKNSNLIIKILICNYHLELFKLLQGPFQFTS
jgi:hypothetical protein